jgi:methylmalonyl-CoA/ethylmalonyl-CoA epimerase
MEHINSHTLCQVGMIVKDIDKSSKVIADFFGVPVPSAGWTDPVEKAETKYLGKPTQARAKLAFIEMGQVTLELIQPDEHPSTWREFLDLHGEGVHHIAFVIKGMKENIAAAEAKGAPLAQTGEYPGGRYAYLNSFDKLGVILELLEHD